MSRQILLACFLWLISGFAVAQQVPGPDAPSRADVLKFLDLMHTRALMAQTMEGMTKQMKLGAENSFKQQVPNATPEQLAKLDDIFDGVFKVLPLDDMVEAIVPIYQKHLTKADLAAITAFYASATGQKVLKEMPMIMSEAMEAGGEIGRKAFDAKSKELEQRIVALEKEANAQPTTDQQR